MGDINLIRTLGDYFKPSHEGYMNTIELLVKNNVDFLKLMDSLDLDGENKERTQLRLFQFSLRNQDNNWLERLPARSITTWEDVTTRFLAQLFLSRRTTKLCNNIPMFQQHQGESLSEAWTRFKDLLQRVPHHGIDYCMENPKQAFVDYSSLCTDEAGGLVSNFLASQDVRSSKFKADFKQQQSEMTNKIDTMLKAITDRIAGALPSDMVKNLKLNTSLVFSVHSYLTIDPQFSSHPSTSINVVKTCSKEASHSQTSLLQTGTYIGREQTKEPESTLEDEFQDLHLNILVLEVLAHASIYNIMLDKYMKSLELGKN
nr:hypothetical protein [Tanacetum cinerariifolium]